MKPGGGGREFWLATLAPLGYLIALRGPTAATRHFALVGGLLLLLAAIVMPKWRKAAVGLATAGAVGQLVHGGVDLLAHPDVVMLRVIVYTAALVYAFLPVPGSIEARGTRWERSLGPVRATGAAAFAVWFLAASGSMLARVDVLAAIFVGLAIHFMALVLHLRATPLKRRAILGGLVLVVFVATFIASHSVAEMATWLAWGSLVMAVFGGLGVQSATAVWQHLLAHPVRLPISTFAALSLIGALSLYLPMSTESPGSISFLDAAFTSMSAVCVTGLVVVDTPSTFSPLGESLLLLLFQMGGLGIMTLYSAAFALASRRLSVRHEQALAAFINVKKRQEIARSLVRILLFTLTCEIVGTLLLWLAFVLDPLPAPIDDDVLDALWRASFTAVSAFCNAGFALQSTSLIPYQSNPLVIHTVSLLITAGGLGPFAALSIPAWLRRKTVPIQVRLALITSIVLLVTGFLFYAGAEWNASLADMSFGDRLHNAWFQSVTLRTAGFNSVDIEAATAPTHMLMVGFMLIGGSPGGTAGGLKTTTIAVLVLMVLGAMRGRTAAIYGRRLIEPRSLYRAASVVTVGIGAFALATLALLFTQSLSLEAAIFEAASALGTVGLSIGGTAKLDAIGKVIVIACMFAGRVGPLALLLFLGERSSTDARRWPSEPVDVG